MWKTSDSGSGPTGRRIFRAHGFHCRIEVARAPARRHAGARGAAREGTDHGLCRIRPDGRLPAHRQPRTRDALGPPAKGRSQADCLGRWCHGHGGRPQRKDRRKAVSRSGYIAAQPGLPEGPVGALPRFRRSSRSKGGQQLRLVQGLQFPRLHPGRRQAHHRQLHDRQGLCEEPPRRGHELH